MSIFNVSPSDFIPYEDSFLRTQSIQEVLWLYIQDDTEFEIEVITPCKAVIKPFGNGGYVTFVAQVTKSTEDEFLYKGSYIVISFPIKAWDRALRSVPIHIKRRWLNMKSNNLWFKAVKLGKTSLKFIDIERRETTKEQEEHADKFYKEWLDE